MPNKSRKKKSKTKTKSKFTGGKKLRRSKLRKKGRVTKHVGGKWKWPWRKNKSKIAPNIKNNWVKVNHKDVLPLTNEDNLNKRAILYDSKKFNIKTLQSKPSSGTGPYNSQTKTQPFQPEFRKVQQYYGYGNNENNGNRSQSNIRRAPIYEDTPPNPPFLNNQKEALKCLEKLNIDSEKLNQITQILQSP